MTPLVTRRARVESADAVVKCEHPVMSRTSRICSRPATFAIEINNQVVTIRVMSVDVHLVCGVHARSLQTRWPTIPLARALQGGRG